jgi:DNA mismatch repair protein MutH
MELPYNPSDKKSIIAFAKKIIGKSIIPDFAKNIEDLNLKNTDKGLLGKAIEQLYFQYPPNSDKQADFSEAGLELKTAGLKTLARNKGFNAKERLVLSIIDYNRIITQDFDQDFLKGKNAHLLLIFYLYTKGINQLNSEIKLVGDWEFPKDDIEIIKKDWLYIQTKVNNGFAHELSEGDTFYLGACTKGANASSLRDQPNKNIRAKQRAFSLKQAYVNHIIASIAAIDNQKKIVYGKLIADSSVAKKQTIEEIVLDKFKLLLNKPIKELADTFNIKADLKAKNYYSIVSKAIIKSVFDVPEKEEVENYIEEFVKAGICVRTVRLKENNLPEEDVSFPIFKYEEIINQEWEDSSFKDILENKFLFIFFKSKGEELCLDTVKFWNMPNSDLLKVEEVWNRTKEIVSKGEIVDVIKINKNGESRYSTNFPGKKFSTVSHVRPHALNFNDTYSLPVADKITQLDKYMKHSFWLNASYVKSEIYLK